MYHLQHLDTKQKTATASTPHRQSPPLCWHPTTSEPSGLPSFPHPLGAKGPNLWKPRTSPEAAQMMQLLKSVHLVVRAAGPQSATFIPLVSACWYFGTMILIVRYICLNRNTILNCYTAFTGHGFQDSTVEPSSYKTQDPQLPRACSKISKSKPCNHPWIGNNGWGK